MTSPASLVELRLRAIFFKLFEENCGEVLKNYNYFMPLYKWKLDVNSKKAEEYRKQIKEAYSGLMKPSVAKQEPYLHMR